MPRRLLVFALLAWMGRAAAAEPLRFQVVYGKIPNLVYQLDCVSGAIPSCSREAFRAQWDREMLRDDEDRAALARWKEVAVRYGGSVALELPVEMPLERRGSEVQLGARLRVAGMLARSREDFVDRVGVVVLPADRAILGEVLARFEPRFEPVWRRGEPAGRAFAAELEQLLARPDLLTLVEQLRQLYDAQVPGDRPLPFVILDRPALGGGTATHGEQIDGVSLLEVLSGEKAADRIDVAIHELCHFFYFSGRPETIAGLQRRFLEAAQPGAVGAYRVFDEAVATALGNGVVQRLIDRPDFERRLVRPGGFYNDPDIDRAAKALLPFLDAWLPTGKSLADPTFADGYLAALAKEYGPALAAPRLALFSVLLFQEEGFGGSVADLLRGRTHITNMSAVRGTIDDPEIGPWLAGGTGTGIFVVQRQSLRGLVPLGVLTAAEARSLGRARGPIMLGKRWRKHEALYVIVTPDTAGADRAVALLTAAPAPLLGETRF